MVQRWSTLRRRKAVRIGLLVLAAVLLALLIVRLVRGGSRDVVPAGTNEERVEFLTSLGWEVDSVPISEQTIRLPREFPDVLKEYNELQKEQGFDLEKYAGKEITMYCYTVRDENADTQCSLYVYKNKVIGGDVHSVAFDGNMVGLR